MICRICGLDAGYGSLGGRDICAPCDCGVPADVSRLRVQLAAAEARAERLEVEFRIATNIRALADSTYRVRAELAEARAEQAELAQRWQPIATAPKHGPILVAVGAQAGALSWRAVDIAKRDLSGTLWLSHEGYNLQPTHWMPLPAPPTNS